MGSQDYGWAPIVLAVGLAGLISACSPGNGQSGDTPDAAQTIASGAELFDLNCGPCHGADGRGPALESLKALNSEQLREAIRNHPTAGQIPSRLPANELGDLIEFLDQ